MNVGWARRAEIESGKAAALHLHRAQCIRLGAFAKDSDRDRAICRDIRSHNAMAEEFRMFELVGVEYENDESVITIGLSAPLDARREASDSAANLLAIVRKSRKEAEALQAAFKSRECSRECAFRNQLADMLKGVS